MKRTAPRRMIEVADAADSDSHVLEGEQEDEEKKLHNCWSCRCCLRKTEGRAAPLAVAVDAAIVVVVGVVAAAALSETLGAEFEARKVARIAAAPLLPLRWPEVC